MSQTTGQQVGLCPVCDSEDIDDTIDAFGGVCEECGFVIHDSTDTASLDWMVTQEDSKQSEEKDWLTECRVQNATEQRLAEAFDSLEDIADRLNLSIELRQKAADIYCDGFRTETTDGRETTCVVGACVRLASLQVGEPVPTGRLTGLPAVEEKKFRLSQSALQEDLELAAQTPRPEDYVSFLTKTLELDDSQAQAVESKLEDLAGNIALVGKDPAGIAGAALYRTDEECTQASAADAAGVSTETIRQRTLQLQELVAHG